MALRIEVDARLLRAGGIGRYLRELSRRWLARPDVAGVAFHGRPAELEPFLAAHDGRGVGSIVPWGDPPYSPLAQLRWPLRRAGVGTGAPPPDVWFFPHYDVPLVGHPPRSVVAVHDLIHFQEPEGFPAWKRAVGSVLLRGALERASAVVTVSETSRDAICAWRPETCGKVRVVPNGVGAPFRDNRGGAVGDVPAPGDGPFLLCVGPAKRHKNLEQAVRTLAHLPAHEGWRLVLVGPDAAEVPALVRRAGHPALAPRVVVTGRVTDDALGSLYERASAVLVPSRLEGFGLPVLEARACGARVIAPDLPWARELAASGVVLVRGWEGGAWARAVRAGADDGDVDRGGDGDVAVRRRAGFPPNLWRWDETAERTFDVLRDVAEVGAGQRED